MFDLLNIVKPLPCKDNPLLSSVHHCFLNTSKLSSKILQHIRDFQYQRCNQPSAVGYKRIESRKLIIFSNPPQFNDAIEFLEKLTLDWMRNWKRVATSTWLLVTWLGYEPFGAPVETWWVRMAVVFIRQKIILIVCHIKNAIRESHVMPQILLIRQVSEIVWTELEWISPVFIFLIMLANFLQIIFKRFSSSIFTKFHAKGFIVKSLVA